MAMMDILSKFKRSGKAIDLGTFAMVINCAEVLFNRYCFLGNKAKYYHVTHDPSTS